MKEKRSSDLDFVYIIPLLNLSPTSLRSYLLKYVNQKQPLPFCLDWKDRVRFMCEHLEIIPQTCHQLFEEHQILLTKPLKDLREMVLLLKNEGKVNAKELLQDIWVLRHNYYRIKSRIQKTNELQIDFRPWMGRCNERSFEIRCERQVLQKSILGGRTLSQFISDRLNVPQSDVQRLIIDTDKIESVSIEKLDKVFDVLLQQNVNCDTIVRNIKMVEFSPETLIKRIGQVRRVFGNDDYINLITLDRRNYEKRFLATARRHSLGQQAKAELIEDLSKC